MQGWISTGLSPSQSFSSLGDAGVWSRSVYTAFFAAAAAACVSAGLNSIREDTGTKPTTAQNEVDEIRPLLSVVTPNGVFKSSTGELKKSGSP